MAPPPVYKANPEISDGTGRKQDQSQIILVLEALSLNRKISPTSLTATNLSSCHHHFSPRLLEKPPNFPAFKYLASLSSYLILPPYYNAGQCFIKKGFPGGSVVNNPPAKEEKQETSVGSLGREGPLEEELATHSNPLWIIPWTEKPGRL